MTKVTGHKSQSQHVISHDNCGKVMHRPYSSCISSVQKIMETLLSFLYVKNMQSRNGVTQSEAELLRSRRELTTKIENNLGLSLCAML